MSCTVWFPWPKDAGAHLEDRVTYHELLSCEYALSAGFMVTGLGRSYTKTPTKKLLFFHVSIEDRMVTVGFNLDCAARIFERPTANER